MYKRQTVDKLGYFQNLSFYVPEDTTAGETILTVTSTADVSGASIRASVYDLSLIYIYGGHAVKFDEVGMGASIDFDDGARAEDGMADAGACLLYTSH